VPGDSAGFVDELHRRWKERQAGRSPVEERTGSNAGGPSSPPPTRDAAHKVFLSYSHDDRDKAEKLFTFLSERRIDVWKDDAGGLTKGANWDIEIKHRIADCACFVPLVSRNTARESDSYFWLEWNGAAERTLRMDRANRKFIFPVLSENGVEIPEIFGAMQATRLFDPADMNALADGLRMEQQRFRKEQRALS
jgi:hypothetical protein